jgi:hypothetical protein
MVQIGENRRAVGRRATQTSALVWFALAIAAALLLWLVVAAASSGGWDRLLPKDQPFVPYFAT